MQSESPFNKIPPVIVLIVLAIAGIEAVLTLAELGIAGGGDATKQEGAGTAAPTIQGDVNALSDSLIERGKQEGKQELQRNLVEQQNIFTQFGHLEKIIGKEKFEAIRTAAITN